MIAVVPSRAAWTLYPIVGDVFAYLCVVGLIGLAVIAVRPRRAADATVLQPLPA
jgi:apolipoprotein N-acyltransferase